MFRDNIIVVVAAVPSDNEVNLLYGWDRCSGGGQA